MTLTRTKHLKIFNDQSLSNDDLVEHLAIAHRSKFALHQLMKLGMEAIPALRKGLCHENLNVRIGCCRVLDHFFDESSLPELVSNLENDDPEVRMWTIHTLACEKCKEGECRPGEEFVIPKVVKMLLHDQNRKVRQMAAGMLGPSVHRSKIALESIKYAHKNDIHPVVRKICGWWIPGGARYKKIKSK